MNLLARLPTPARHLVVRARDYAWIAQWQAQALLLPHDEATLLRGRRVSVLLLPGIYETWGVMLPLARALHAAGHPVQVVPDLGRNAATLATSADRVVTRLNALGLSRVVLVAHSKGGLIGKLVMSHPGLTCEIVGLVTVNTPFGGSRYARFFPARSVRALAPRDEHVLALAAQVGPNSRVASLYAPFDPHVPEGSSLKGARNLPLPVDGHFSPLGDPAVHRLAVQEVQRFEAEATQPRAVSNA